MMLSKRFPQLLALQFSRRQFHQQFRTCPPYLRYLSACYVSEAEAARIYPAPLSLTSPVCFSRQQVLAGAVGFPAPIASKMKSSHPEGPIPNNSAEKSDVSQCLQKSGGKRILLFHSVQVLTSQSGPFQLHLCSAQSYPHPTLTHSKVKRGPKGRLICS